MKKTLSPVLAVLSLFVLAACATMKFEPCHIRQVAVRVGAEARQITKPADLTLVVSAFDRAILLDVDSDQLRDEILRGVAIDIVGAKPAAGRWFYDRTEGRFMKLDHSKKIMYVLRPTDRDVVNKLFFE